MAILDPDTEAGVVSLPAELNVLSSTSMTVAAMRRFLIRAGSAGDWMIWIAQRGGRRRSIIESSASYQGKPLRRL